MAKTKKLIIGNWKMHPNTHTDASNIFSEIKEYASGLQNVQTVICPPFVFIDKLAQEYTGHRILFGGQDVFTQTSGSYTGEVSALQLYSVGADYVIIGHSERRKLGETDEVIATKIRIALGNKLTPIVCIGESERDTHGEYLRFLRRQIEKAFSEIKKKDILNVVLAYEPIWAIGKTGDEAINAQKLHETSLYMQRVLREEYGNVIADNTTIIYGGSVEPNNAEELLREGDVKGFLVGHASLEPKAFNKILEIANNIARS